MPDTVLTSRNHAALSPCTKATEAQQRNFCLYLLKGSMGHRHFLEPHLSKETMEKLDAALRAADAEIRASNQLHSKHPSHQPKESSHGPA